MRGSDHKSNFFVACWCFLHVGQYLHKEDYICVKNTVMKVEGFHTDLDFSCEPLPWVMFSKSLHGCKELNAFPQSNSGFLLLRLEHALMLLVGLHTIFTQI